MPLINKGTLDGHFPPNFTPWFDLQFPGGAPDDDAFHWFLEAYDLCTYNFQVLGGKSARNGIRVDVTWLSESALDPDDLDNFNVFARTSYVGLVSNFHRFTIEILDSLHSRGGPLGGKTFYQESVVHELAHVVITMLVATGGYTVETLTAELGPMLGLSVWNDPGVAWEDRILEATAETFKDIYMPKAARVYSNRTNGKLPRVRFDDFKHVIQAPHYGVMANEVYDRLERDDYLWQQNPLDRFDAHFRNEGIGVDVSMGFSPDGGWVPDSYVILDDGGLNAYYDVGKFDSFYIVADVTNLPWDPAQTPAFDEQGIYDTVAMSDGAVPAFLFNWSFVGGFNYNGTDGANEFDHGDYPHQTSDSDPFAPRWHLCADVLLSHPDRCFMWESAADGKTMVAFRVDIPADATWMFFIWDLYCSSNDLPGVGEGTGVSPSSDRGVEGWGQFRPFQLLPHPPWPGGVPGSITAGAARRGARASKRRHGGSRAFRVA